MKEFYMGYCEEVLDKGMDLYQYLPDKDRIQEVYLVEGKSEEDIISLITIRMKSIYKNLNLSESNSMRKDMMGSYDPDEHISVTGYDRDNVSPDFQFVKELRVQTGHGDIYKYHLILVNDLSLKKQGRFNKVVIISFLKKLS